MQNDSLKFKIIFFIVIFVFGGAVAFSYFGAQQDFVRPILAKDEDEEDKEDKEDEEDEEDDDDDDRFEVIDTNPDNNTAQKNETKTITTKLSATVTQTATTTVRHDSDGDGKYDDEDAHPTINEYFIVADDNQNGIDDQYE